MSFFGIIFLFVVANICVSCGDHATKQSWRTNKAQQSVEISNIENDTGISFPVGSSVLYFSEENIVIDASWVAKVLLPDSSYDSFRKIILNKKLDKTKVTGAFSESIDWWNPKDIVLTHQYFEGSQTIIKIVISKELENYVAYIEYIIF